MLKNVFLFVFMFSMILSFGQKSTLLKNINFRAKELHHSLNKTGDSLILSSEKLIHNVEIFNQDFERIIEVKANEVKIPLYDTPLGRLVVQARMPDKRILLTLLRHETLERPADNISNSDIEEREITELTPNFGRSATIIPLNSEVSFSDKFTGEIHAIEYSTLALEGLNVDQDESESENQKGLSISDMLNWKSKKDKTSDKVFWISHVINSGTTSRKIMKMVTHDEADQLITTYKAEHKTKQGKLNTLFIWEIYDTALFIKEQTKNSDYINSNYSDYFNVIPYFSSSQMMIASN